MLERVEKNSGISGICWKAEAFGEVWKMSEN
jgi:hypothetical protein